MRREEGYMDEYYNNTEWALSVRESGIPDAGMGLYTEEDIPACSYIGTYEGVLTKDTNMLSSYSFEVSPRYFIDAREFPRCYIAMVNDARNSSFTYNCEFRMRNKREIKNRRIELYAITHIPKGSELFANYGDDYWDT